ncbi:MAG: fumarylacetoacetate hydrolase family protein [Sediminibacterium sp.]|nr:fumarylacetoacetate hydrolase family protein [Sediminibacterium sp.]
MKIVCVGRNYAEHARELGNEVPEEPVIFMKPSTALLGAGQQFHYPAFTSDLHYEAELVLRVSATATNIAAADALHHIDAITVGIDFTARDIQANLKKKGLPWEKAKAWDHSAILGSWHSIPSGEIHFSLKKNGEWVQQGSTHYMIFPFDTLVAHISQYFTLEPGDLIYTGTPAGVGPCVAGDVLEGYLENQEVFSLTIHA